MIRAVCEKSTAVPIHCGQADRELALAVLEIVGHYVVDH